MFVFSVDNNITFLLCVDTTVARCAPCPVPSNTHSISYISLNRASPSPSYISYNFFFSAILLTQVHFRVDGALGFFIHNGEKHGKKIHYSNLMAFFILSFLANMKFIL